MASLYKLPEYEQHPIALELMPGGMDDEEFDAFCTDIEQRGILFPATLFEGKVLDGWHRYRAAKRTGSELKFLEYKGKDPAGYVAAVNALRRKLSSLQRALVGARLHRDYGLSQREACKKLGISNEVLSMVLKAMDSKNTRIIKRIETESDYSRGMLREELAESGVLTVRTKPETVHNTSNVPNSVFDMGRTHGGSATDNSDDDDAEDDEDEHLPEVGKRVSHPERRPKKTAAQLMSDDFKALMHDEKIAFLQMVWPEAVTLLEEAELKVPGTRKLAPVPSGEMVQPGTPLDALKASVAPTKKAPTKKAKVAA